MAMDPTSAAQSLETAWKGHLVSSESDAIDKVGDAAVALLAALTPSSDGVASGLAAFKAALVGMGANNATAAKLVSAWAAYATTIAAGMTPPGAVPPGPLTFSFANTGDFATAAATFIDPVHAWLVTGTQPTPGGPINWA